MVSETLDYIRNELPPTDVLVLDALLWEGRNPFHYNLWEALELARALHTHGMKTYLVGMSCDTFLPHDEMNAYLRETCDIEVAMARERMAIELPGRWR